MRTKVITLCEETWIMASNKLNFSEWVRAQLLAEDERRREQDRKADEIFKATGQWPEWYQ